VRYGDGTDTTAFRRSVNDGWVMRSYSSGNNNWRISMVTEQLQVFIVMSYVMLATMPLITVVLISIILRRKVASEQRMIGTLSAMGYTKGRLARHYVGFAVLPGIVGGIIAAVIAVAAAQPLAEFGLTDYEPMHVTGHLNPVIAVVGILVPTAMYALAALCAVRKLLKRDTVELLNGNAGGSRKARHLLAGSKMDFKYKFAIRTILGNPTRSLVIVLGVFLGCFITLWGLGMFDSMDNAGDAAASEMGSYQHQYVLNRLLSENPYGGETLLVSSMESDSGDSVAVIGTDADNGLLNLADEDGNAVDVEDGYYVTSLASYAYGWREGDTVTLTNPFTLEETDIKVAGVVRNNVQKAVVAGKGLVEDLTGLDAELFNSIVSKTALSIPESEVAKEIRTSSFREQADTMVREVSEMLWLIFALGAILCVASVYVAVDMLLNESRSNISMLKVLGYRDRKIDRIVLDANHVLLPIGILLAVPAAVAACDFYFGFLVDYGLMLMQTRIAPSSYAISIGITVACYAGSLLLLRGKVKRVDMVECLKDNRE
jgi:putative ABC transport system permease protein